MSVLDVAIGALEYRRERRVLESALEPQWRQMAGSLSGG